MAVDHRRIRQARRWFFLLVFGCNSPFSLPPHDCLTDTDLPGAKGRQGGPLYDHRRRRGGMNAGQTTYNY